MVRRLAYGGGTGWWDSRPVRISPIIRPKTGVVALGGALEMGEMADGRLASLF